jgi:hypothetical protein
MRERSTNLQVQYCIRQLIADLPHAALHRKEVIDEIACCETRWRSDKGSMGSALRTEAY